MLIHAFRIENDGERFCINSQAGTLISAELPASIISCVWDPVAKRVFNMLIDVAAFSQDGIFLLLESIPVTTEEEELETGGRR